MAANDNSLIVRVGANLDDLKSGLTAADGVVVAFAESVGHVLGDAIEYTVGKIAELIAELPEIAIHGAEVADVEENFQRLTAAAGGLGTVLDTLRAGTHNTVDDFALMTRVNKDLAAGLNLTDEQFGTLAKGAFALAQATGVDVAHALDTMSDALVKGKAKALELLTGKIDLKEAEQEYADALGIEVKDLSDAQKLEADRLAMLDAVTAATARLGEQTDGLDEKVQQAHVAWTNFIDDLGKAIAKSPVLEEALDGVRQVLIDTFGGTSQEAVRQLTDLVNQFTIAVVDAAAMSARVGAGMMEGWHALGVVFDTLYNGLLHIESGMLKTQLVALQVKAFVEPWNDWTQAITDVQNHIAGVQQTITDNKHAIDDHESAEAKWAVRGEELAQKFEALGLKLRQTKDATDNFVGPINQVGDAAASAGPKLGALGTSADDAGDAMKQAARDAADLQTAVNAMAELTYANQKKVQDQTLRMRNDAVVAALKARQEEQATNDAFLKSAYDAAVAQDELNASLAETPAPASAANESVKQFSNTLVLGVQNLEQLNAALSDFYDQFSGNSAGTPGVGSYGTMGPQGMPRMSSGPKGDWFGLGMGGAISGRQAGGPVDSGTPYVVGEHGPELFVPGSSGAIVPNGAAGSVTNNFYISQPLGTPQAIAAAVGAAQMSSMKSRGDRFRPSGV